MLTKRSYVMPENEWLWFSVSDSSVHSVSCTDLWARLLIAAMPERLPAARAHPSPPRPPGPPNPPRSNCRVHSRLS